MLAVHQILTLAAAYANDTGMGWRDALDAVAREPGVTRIALDQARHTTRVWRCIDGATDNGYRALVLAARATKGPTFRAQETETEHMYATPWPPMAISG